jgi:adenylate cyclase
VRVTAQLIDATTGNHLWAERYDRDLQDIFAVQDEITRTIAATAAGRVESVGTALAKRKSTTHLSAYDLVLRAHETLDRAYSDTDFLRQGALRSARELLERAVQIDPDYARVRIELARSYMFEWLYAGNTKDLEQFFSNAHTAVWLDPDDSSSHRLLGLAHLFHRRYDEARFHIERALSINPSDTMVMHNMAVYLEFIGKPSESIEWSKKSMLLDPLVPHLSLNSRETVGMALYSLGQYGEALKAFLSLDEQALPRHYILAATYAQLDRLDEAHAEAALCMEQFSPAPGARHVSGIVLDRESRLRAIRAIWKTYKHQADRDRWLNAMRKAGIPV